MRALKSEAVADRCVGEEVVKASLKPRPGMLGIMRWKGWVLVGEGGWVRGLYRVGRLKGVSGKGGMRRRGRACGCGERMWTKWMRNGGLSGVGQMGLRY